MEIFSAARSMVHLHTGGQPDNDIRSVLGSNGQASKITSQSASPTIRILYIEDEKDLVTLVQLIFSRKGYQIMGAPTIALAKELIERETIDLFFVDINLPDGTGWEMLDYLGQHEQYDKTPKIIMSAQMVDQKHQMENGSKKRYSAIIGKPFQVNTLIDVTQRLLNNRQPSH